MKKTKLHEKPSRIPDISEQDISNKIKEYTEQVLSLNTESAKAQKFLILLKDIFGDVNAGFVEDYLHGVEKYVSVKNKDIILRGRIDALYGNLIIEFEKDLRKSLNEALEQLKQYTSYLIQSGEKTNYLCLATDGILFNVYLPKIKSDNEIELEDIEKIDLTKIAPYDAYFYLDRYFFRKAKLHPKTEDIVRDFGIKSPAFKYSLNTLELIWNSIKERSDFKVIYDNWERYLRVTYGSIIGSEELFLRHSYLAVFTKLIVWMRLSESSGIHSADEVIKILDGEFFIEQGIDNFLEEDFFSWIVRERTKDAGLDISRKLINQLSNYNLRELSEDILKSLYQELVDPETRHDLGEYYTPDWLAQRMVEHILKDNPKASVLDPSCGSGTFLYMAIRHKKHILGTKQETLEHIVKNVVGIDIHPLAAITAKTNYLLALGDLLKKRGAKRIQIPVYLSDSINPPEEKIQHDLLTPVPSYHTQIGGKEAYIPDTVINDPVLYDNVIETTKEFARHFAGKEGGLEAYENFVRHRISQLGDKNTIAMLYSTAKAMKELIEEEKDSIWAFVLKNMYKPLFLKDKFDVIIGNPPWLSYRYVDKGEYQKILKEMIVEKYKLLSGLSTEGKKIKVKVELMTHMELATLFFLRTANLYLKDKGMIGFVMPRSLFTADQHNTFRKQQYQIKLGFKEIWDLEKVKPLFNVPTCVFIARKGEKTSPPYKTEFISGNLERKNAGMVDAEKSLHITKGNLYVSDRGKRSFLSPSEEGYVEHGRSPYHAMFKQGATIVPRNFWFVDIKPHLKIGFNPSAPYVETSEASERTAKENYKGISFKGNIEKDFLYATLLSTDIVPFGHLSFRIVVLPIENVIARQSRSNLKDEIPRSSRNDMRRNRDDSLGEFSGCSIIKESEAADKGYIHLSKWLHKAQKTWEEKRREKADKMDVYQRLDHVKGITGQKPSAKYKVLYPTSATYLCGCVVERKAIKIEIEGQEFELKDFIAESKEYYFETDKKVEAYYLCSILNSPTVDELIKPMQSRGLFGPRDIHKKVWELPIPQFKESNKDHIKLSELGEESTKKVSKFLSKAIPQKSIGNLRKVVKTELEDKIKEIDGIVKRILKG
jgi:type I restriction-modification system DNA methylase subunit